MWSGTKSLSPDVVLTIQNYHFLRRPLAITRPAIMFQPLPLNMLRVRARGEQGGGSILSTYV